MSPLGMRVEPGILTISYSADSADLVRGSSVDKAPVRGRPCKADGPRTARRARFPSAMRPWTPQHDGPQRDKVTHHGRTNAPLAREFAASGAFSLVVAGVVS